MALGEGLIDTLSGDPLELLSDADVGTVMFTLVGGNTTATVVGADFDGCAGESYIHQIDALLTE